MKQTLITFLILASAFTTNLAQGTGSLGAMDARTTAMGRTYTIVSRGVFALNRNSANLMLSENKHLQISTHFPLPNLSFKVGTDFMDLEEYNYFFGGEADATGATSGRLLTDDDKQRMIDLFQDGGKIFSEINLMHFAATYKVNEKIGAFGFAMGDAIYIDFRFPSGIIDLAMYGNPIDKVYNFNNLDINASWIRSYGLSYARDLPFVFPKVFKQFSAGITFKIVQGFAYARVENVNTTFTTTAQNEIVGDANILAYTAFSPDFGVKYDFEDEEKSSSFSPFPQAAGSGTGIDIGFSARLNDKINVGLAITDIGSITWDKGTAQFVSSGSFKIDDVLNNEQTDTLKNAFIGESKPIGSFDSDLPTALRIGVSYQIYGSLDTAGYMLSLDYNQGLNDEPGNSTTPRVSLGGEWNPGKWFPYLRGGFSFGGLVGFTWSIGGGIGLGPAKLDLAITDFQNAVVPSNAKRLAFYLSSRWVF